MALGGGLDSSRKPEVDRIVKRVLDAYETLNDLPSLIPSPSVNEAFGEMVNCCVGVPEKAVSQECVLPCRLLADARSAEVGLLICMLNQSPSRPLLMSWFESDRI